MPEWLVFPFIDSRLFSVDKIRLAVARRANLNVWCMYATCP